MAVTGRRVKPGFVWLVALIGLPLLGIGVAEIRGGTGQGGAIALVIAGAVLLVLPFVIDRLEQLTLGTRRVELRLSRSFAASGAPRTAELLERSGLTGFAESYALIHTELDDPAYMSARIHLQSLLVERAAAVARRQKLDAAEVRTLFRHAAPIGRVLVLGLMEGDRSLADPATILSAISESRTGNEQYHGLRLAELYWRDLTPEERDAVRNAIDQDTDLADARDDSDRRQLADKLLRRARSADVPPPPAPPVRPTTGAGTPKASGSQAESSAAASRR